jgi:lipoprotein-anchoring transpeptidase ErfK/SrfK
MRYVLTAAAAGAVLAGSANSAHAFFHLLFEPQPHAQTQQYYRQPQHQSQTQQYYRSEPTSRVQISPIPRQTVAFNEGYEPGTIVVKTAERRLYLVLEDGKAMRYGVGVGRKGFTWSGTHSITLKREWPDWRPPTAMLRRRPDLPRYMRGGIANPLGARAMYIGDTEFRIHGSNEPWSIGTAVSSGCIRLTNADVIDLYKRVQVGAKVVVL